VVAGGRVVFDGKAAALREQPVLEKAYLGGGPTALSARTQYT
jgi:hypothetical protein